MSVPNTLTNNTVADADEVMANFNYLDSQITAVMSALNPVGTIREFNVSTDPATLLGFGTWAPFGTGRVTVAIDAGQTEFDTNGKTGGSKTHTLSIDEMPIHTHTQNPHTHSRSNQYSISGFRTGTGGQGFRADSSLLYTGSNNYDTIDNATATNQNAGGNGAHNNLQPYIVVYRWVRTA
jgi:hypothetical protein